MENLQTGKKLSTGGRLAILFFIIIVALVLDPSLGPNALRIIIEILSYPVNNAPR